MQNKSQEIEQYLNGHSVYLVGQFLLPKSFNFIVAIDLLAPVAKTYVWECAGLMGSGKTTVGKILSLVLSYSFFDRFVL